MVRAPSQLLAWDVSLDGTTAVSSTFSPTGTAATIDIWDLTTGQPKKQIKIAGSSYLHEVAIDAKAKTVAARDASNHKLHLFDARTGQPVRDFSVNSPFQAWALARDGNHVVVSSNAVPLDPTSATEILVCRLDANASELQKIITGAYLWGFELSRDGSRLAVWSPQRVEVWNVRSGKRLWQTENGLSLNPWATNFSLMMDNWRLSADGSRIVGLTGRDGIGIYDAATGTRLHLLGGFNRPLHAAMYSVAFLVWAVIWGLVARRQRLREIAAGVVAPPPVLRSPWSGIYWLLGILLVITLVYATLSSQALAGGFSLWRFFTGAGTILGLIFLAIAVVVAIQYAYAWAFPVAFARRQARLLTREKGRQVQHGMVQGWFLGESTIEREFPRHIEEVRRLVSDLLGREIVLRYPLLVIGLEHQDQFDKLHARHMPHGAISVQRWWVDEVRICQEAFCRYAASPVQGLRNASALALVRRYWRMDVPQWLGTWLIGYCSREDRYEADIRQATRLLRTLDAGQLKERWDQLFGYSLLAWSRLVLAKEDADELRQLSEINALASSLGAFFLLSPERREKLFAFVRGLGRKVHVDEAFSRQFGVRPAELFDQWRAWLEEQPIVPFDRPRPEAAAYVRQFLLPDIVNPHVRIEQRRRSVVALAATGDLSAAETMIAILADETSPLRADALWSLRALTGHAGGENVDEWREWLSTAAGPPSEPPPVRSTWPQDLPLEEPVQAQLADGPARLAVTPSAPTIMDRLNNPPWELGVARLVWGIGGVWGIIIATSLAFYIAVPLVLPFLGGLLLVGLMTLSRAAGRLWWGLDRLPAYQMGCFFSCDPVNTVGGLITAILVRSAPVKDYLRSVGGS
jgi:hypothetical protein